MPQLPAVTRRFTPVRWRQEPLFYMRPSTLALRLAATAPHPGMNTHLNQVLDDHAAAHGWSVRLTNAVRYTLRALQATQATPGSRIRSTEVQAVSGDSNVTVESTLEILAIAGVLDDDRVNPLRRYFDRNTRCLPEPMLSQLDFWFTVVSKGSTRPPRFKPRHEATVRAHLRYMLPALRAWAAAGHDTLAEITRDDVNAALPTSGNDRVYLGSALRSLFRVLKGHKKVFINPTAQLPIGKTHKNIPMPLDTSVIRAALDNPDPTGALAVALIVFHGLAAHEVRHIQLTDIRDGRLTVGDRSIPLAEPVRARLTSYLDLRNRLWLNSRNPHLFLNRRSAPRLCPVGESWPLRQAGLQPQALREDRILAEIHATGGDIRRLCDLFGLSVSGTIRYAAAIPHPSLTDE